MSRTRLDTSKPKERVAYLLRHGSLPPSSLSVVLRSEKFTQSQIDNALKEMESEGLIKKTRQTWSYKLVGNIVSVHKCVVCTRGNCIDCVSLTCDCDCKEMDT